MTDAATEQTRVSLTISSWYHVIVLIASLAMMFAVLMQRMDKGLELANEAIQISRTNSQQLVELRMDQQAVKDDLLYFHKEYNSDFERYIRDPRKDK